ncbi:MAG: hypothetical protein Q9186_001950 [Xanthomendoza sp. 1 TL-2023]
MSKRLFKLFFTVPQSHLEVCKQAVFSAGAGSYADGKYSEVCFETTGTGQFVPSAGAEPAVGDVGEVVKVVETKVEVLCVGKEVVTAAVEKLKRAHPYEEVAYEVYAIEDA